MESSYISYFQTLGNDVLGCLPQENKQNFVRFSRAYLIMQEKDYYIGEYIFKMHWNKCFLTNQKIKSIKHFSQILFNRNFNTENGTIWSPSSFLNTIIWFCNNKKLSVTEGLIYTIHKNIFQICNPNWQLNGLKTKSKN